MENLTTKLKTQFLQTDSVEADTNDFSPFRAAIIGKIARFVFRTPKRSIFALLFMGVFVVGGYYFLNKSTPEEIARKELAAAVAIVGKLIILPEGDEPVLATVTDAETLIKQQTFFTGSVNGDQLLLFPKNMKAILYSPSRGVIVNVGPIENTGGASANTTPVSLESSALNAEVSSIENVISVEIRNGSGKNGHGASIAQEIKDDSAYLVVSITDANLSNYEKTVVVDIAKKPGQRDLINALAEKVLGVVVEKMPEGEAVSSADVLVILGAK